MQRSASSTAFRFLLTFLFFLIILGITNTSYSDFFTVTSTNDSGTGSLREAISNASSSDIIAFSLPGSGPWTITLNTQIGMSNKSNLNIVGPGEPGLLTIAGSESATSIMLFRIYSTSSVSIQNITFTGADNMLSNGGAFYVEGSLNLYNCIVTGNEANGGGGICVNDHGSLLLSSCQITENTAINGNGGGIFLGNDTSLSIDNSVISNNTISASGGGGGIFAYSFSEPASISDTIISDNTSRLDGGGLCIGSPSGETSTLIMTNCIISNNTINSGYSGGGMALKNGNTRITNCTFSGNQAGSTGGGLYFTAYDSVAYLELSFCTLTGNRSDYDNTTSTPSSGGGIYHLSTSVGQFRVKSTIVADNYKGSGAVEAWSDCVAFSSAPFTSYGYNLISRGESQTGFTNGVLKDKVGTASNPIDAGLDALADNGGDTQTHALFSNSPAINAGGPAEDITGDPVSKDQRGEPRPQRGRSDIGAYESAFSTGTFAPMFLLLN